MRERLREARDDLERLTRDATAEELPDRLRFFVEQGGEAESLLVFGESRYDQRVLLPSRGVVGSEAAVRWAATRDELEAERLPPPQQAARLQLKTIPQVETATWVAEHAATTAITTAAQAAGVTLEPGDASDAPAAPASPEASA